MTKKATIKNIERKGKFAKKYVRLRRARMEKARLIKKLNLIPRKQLPLPVNILTSVQVSTRNFAAYTDSKHIAQRLNHQMYRHDSFYPSFKDPI